MGGDHGPAVCVRGALLASQRIPNVRFQLHGDEAAIEAELARMPALLPLVQVVHAERAIAMDEKPAQAMRRGKGTSLWGAIEAVKSGEAAAVVSAGNTGALMAISKLQLRMAAELERPAIVASWPTARGVSVVLDVGANVESDAEQLVEFAIMGAAFHRAVHGSTKPTVGLLNVGSEELKGNDAVRGAAHILRSSKLPIAFHGFVEGNDITEGLVDVVVTDGFTGNIALKTAEGAAKLVGQYLRKALKRSMLGMLGAMLAAGALNTLRRNLDPRASSGGMFLGLNGIVVKAHGGTDAIGFAGAISMAVDMSKADLNARISADRRRLEPAMEQAALT